MKTGILTLLLSTSLFVFGQQPLASSTELNDKSFEQRIKESSIDLVYLQNLEKTVFKESAFFTTVKNVDKEIEFYLKGSVNDDQKKLYCRDGENGKEELLFDPEEYKDENGKSYLIQCFSPNDQGSKVCIALGSKNTKKTILYIVDVQTKKVHEEQINNCINSKVIWMEDGKTFMYCKKYYEVSDTGELLGDVFFHIIGTDPSGDWMITFSNDLPEHY